MSSVTWSIRTAQRVYRFTYAIHNIVAEAKKVEATGKKVRYLNIGDPNQFGFVTPPHLIEAVVKAMRDCHNGYTASPGIVEAREAVAADFTTRGVPTNPDRVLITSGTSEGIELALTAIVDEGEAVLVPSPTYRKENMLNTRNDVKAFMLNDTIAKKDTVKTEKYEFQMTRSPWKAVLYSAVIPGAGQFYNQSYWKIPIIWGVGGYFVYEAVRNNNSFIDYRELYEKSVTETNPNGDQRYKTLREFYRDQRDQFYVYAGLVYFINLFDAYVDAHLFDFDVSDKIRIAGFKNPEKILNIKYNL